MLFYLIPIALVLVGFMLQTSLNNSKKLINDMFPSVPTVPILGNALMFLGDSHKLYVTGLGLFRRFKRSFCLYIGPLPFVLIYTPDELEAVLNSTIHIRKSISYDCLRPWIGQGLVMSTGERWRKSRKLLTPAFHFKILDGFLEVFNKNGNLLCQEMKKKIGGETFDVNKMVKMSALDNICETAMGVSINAQQNPTSDYVNSVHILCHNAFLRTMRPWLKPAFLFHLTHWGWIDRKAMKVVHSFTRDVIESRIKQRRLQRTEPNENDEDLGIKQKKVFMDILIDHYENGLFTVEEVQEEVDTFMFEGHDTITAAISYSIYNISMHPQVQDRLYAEQYRIFGDSMRDVTTDDIAEMKYLEMVIKETLRLQPSVPAFGRAIDAPLKLDDKTTVPAGVDVMIFSVAVHRNPDVWKDPEVFDPERFSVENSLKRHPYAYIPFSAGPRNCIGTKFAFMEMKTTLSKIIRQFKILPGENNDLKLGLEVILISITGVKIALQERTRLKMEDF